MKKAAFRRLFVLLERAMGLAALHSAPASSFGLKALTGILTSASPPCRTTFLWVQIPIAACL